MVFCAVSRCDHNIKQLYFLLCRKAETWLWSTPDEAVYFTLLLNFPKNCFLKQKKCNNESDQEHHGGRSTQIRIPMTHTGASWENRTATFKFEFKIILKFVKQRRTKYVKLFYERCITYLCLICIIDFKIFCLKVDKDIITFVIVVTVNHFIKSL